MFSGALKSFAASAINSGYERSPTPSSTCGAWKIYDAKRKKTGQAYSIFVFERKILDNNSGGLSAPSRRSDGLKAAQEEVVERLKKEANMLARLRHPCVLELVEPVEETRGGLQFVAEAVTGSLATLLAEKDEGEAGGRGGGRRYGREDEARRKRREIEIDELEIQKGLLQLAKALEFLHESANLIHMNLTPEAVMVNAKSDWKICGLGFATNNVKPDLPPNYDPRLPPFVQVSLDYAAPDFVLDRTLSCSCDLFSLGLMMITLYNSPHKSPLETHNSSSTYQRLLSAQSTTPNPSNNFLSSRPMPRHVTSSVLPLLITRRPATRMNARTFQESEYFDNILVSTLRFLDSFPAKTPSEKAAFMRGLPKILSQFPKSVLEKKILPGLVEEMRDGSLLALILPNVFLIVETAQPRIFSEKVLKRLKEVFLNASISSSEPKTAAAKTAERERMAGQEGGLIVILNKLEIIKQKTTALEFKDDVIPLVQLALESPTHSLQDLGLRSLPVILPKLDFPTLKNDFFPIIASVFTKTSSLGIKIRGLEAFRVLCGGTVSFSQASDGLDGIPVSAAQKKEDAPVLDKYTIQEKVIPLLKGIKTKEPAVMMEALAVFAEIGKTCDREVVAMEVLPTLWTMSFGPLINLEQFKSFMATIKALSTKIESEQIRKLSELNSSTPSGNPSSAGEFLSFGPLGSRGSSPAPTDDFEALVLGKKGPDNVRPTDGFEWSQLSSGIGGSRTSSPRPTLSTTNTPKFNWSTPSPNAERQSSNLSSSPSLSTLQPNKPDLGFGSTTGLRAQQTAQQAQPSTPIDWSSATKKPTFPSNSSCFSNSRPTLTPSTSATSAASMNRPASINNGTNGHTTILYGRTQAAAPPVTSSNAEFAGFTIPPPPSANRSNSTNKFSGLGGLGGNTGGSAFGIPLPPPPPASNTAAFGGMKQQFGGLNLGGGASGMNINNIMQPLQPLQPQQPPQWGQTLQLQKNVKEEKGLDQWESLL